MTSREEKLNHVFACLKVSLSEAQQASFIRYSELLAEWNQKVNLTAITEFDEVAEKHFADSCVLALFPELAARLKGRRVIDVGTGAGFPGIPLKILYPEMKLTLLDSLQKRLTFLETVIRELGLSDVQLVHARAEDGAHLVSQREQYDVCVSRAVADLPVLAEYTLPYLKKGGLLAAYKGQDIAEECCRAEKAVRLLGGRFGACRQFVLPGTEYGRSIVEIEKIAETPKRFPRKAGSVSKNPL